MALARYESVAVNTAGDVIPNATVEVRRDQPGRPVVPLWADREGTVTLGNPITTDSEGKFGFHVVGGSYYIRVFTGPSQQPLQQYVRRFQAIGTAGERDVEDLATAIEAGTATFPTIELLQGFTPSADEGIGGKVTTGEDAGFYHYDPLAEEGERWVFDRPLYDTLARMNVTGGDENDIEAEIASGVADSAVIMLWIEAPATNTGPVTINGKAVLTTDDDELLPGRWVEGRTYWFTDEGANYKLRTDSDVSDLVAQAEAAAEAAIAAQGAAEEAAAGAGVTDGDKGDVVVSSAGTSWSVARRFSTVTALLADTAMDYSAGAQIVSAGQIVEAQGFRYEVLASGAPSYHVISDGGVKLNHIPNGRDFHLAALGLIVEDSGAPAKSNNDAVIAKAISVASGAGAGGLIIRPPAGNWYFSDTIAVNKRDIAIVGPGANSNSRGHFRPDEDKPAMKVAADSGYIFNVTLKGFTLTGAPSAGDTSTSTLGLWVDRAHYVTADIDIMFFTATDALACLVTGGDRQASQFSMRNDMRLNINSCYNAVQLGSSDADLDGGVNSNVFSGRWAATTAGIGLNIIQGYQNNIEDVDIEGYAVLVKSAYWGNSISRSNLELASTPFDGIVVASGVKDFSVRDAALLNRVRHEDNWPMNLDCYNGNLAWRAIDGAGENLLINGDFYDGPNGLGNWASGTMFWNSSLGKWQWRTNNLGATGTFRFVPGKFKKHTWYTIGFDAWLDSGSSIASGGVRFRVNGTTDPGYTTGNGESTLQSKAAFCVNGGSDNVGTYPTNAIPNDGVHRHYVARFFTGNNDDFPATLELFNGVTTWSGGHLYVDNIYMVEGTMPGLFSPSAVDLNYRPYGDQITANDTLTTHTANFTASVNGGTYLVDTTGGFVNVTLPSAKSAGRGLRITVVKLVANSTVTVFAAGSENINNASSHAMTSIYATVTVESNGKDRWYIV